MVLKFQDYTKQRLEEDVRLFQNYYKFRQSNTYGLNDELDAFRMAYISSYIAYKYGDKVAKKQFESNLKMDSEYNNETLKEASMKIWNARVGREIAKDLKKSIKGKNLNDNQIKSMLAYSISEKLYDGKMVTSLNENKNYDDFDEVYFEKQEVEKIKPSANKPLEGKIEQNIPKDENKETDNSNTNNQYEYIETPCVGSYEVSGYTKKDGTEVEDYIRTCGAKHIRKVKKKGGDDNDYMDKNIIPTNQNIISVDNNLDYKQIKNPDGSYKFEMRTSEQSIKKSIHNFLHENFKIYRDYEWLNIPQISQKALTKIIPNIFPFLEYYKISLSLADNDIKKIKNNNKDNLYFKFSDLKNSNLKNIIKQKIINSRKLNVNDKNLEEKINNTYIISVKNNSSLTKQIINSTELKQFINKNINEIRAGKLKNKIITIEYEYNTNSYNNLSLYLTLHYVDIYNPHIDKNGNIVMDYIDNFDFEKWKYIETFKIISNKILNKDLTNIKLDETGKNILKELIIYINNNAARQQELMHLEPFILHIPIKIPNNI